jgi:hypothetical protein
MYNCVKDMSAERNNVSLGTPIVGVGSGAYHPKGGVDAARDLTGRLRYGARDVPQPASRADGLRWPSMLAGLWLVGGDGATLGHSLALVLVPRTPLIGERRSTTCAAFCPAETANSGRIKIQMHGKLIDAWSSPSWALLPGLCDCNDYSFE